jgi:hypothetical protein
MHLIFLLLCGAALADVTLRECPTEPVRACPGELVTIEGLQPGDPPCRITADPLPPEQCRGARWYCAAASACALMCLATALVARRLRTNSLRCQQ